MKKVLEWIKTAIWVVIWAMFLIAFVYFLYTFPEMFANAIRGIWDFLIGLVDSVIRFVKTVFA